MSARVQLQILYTEWRRLTESERDAIFAGRWEELVPLQDTKRSLQGEIISATDAWQATADSPAAWRNDYESTFRPMVGELIRLETENQRLLGERVLGVRGALGDLEHTQRRLSGVRRAYGGPVSTGWRSYS
ncbi:MAG: hypothetical protein ACYC23_07115 [Limisphaerales bacterium]